LLQNNYKKILWSSFSVKLARAREATKKAVKMVLWGLLVRIWDFICVHFFLEPNYEAIDEDEVRGGGAHQGHLAKGNELFF
jgi:hypothetical protein